MALIDRIIGPSIQRYLEQISQGFGRTKTSSGTYVGTESPFELVPFRAAINVLSQDVAVLPLKLYRKKGNGRSEATDHPLYSVLRLAPNPRMTAFELREAMMVSLLTWGNSYCYIQRDEYQRTTGLWPLRPDNMKVCLSDVGRVVYSYEPTNDSIEPQDFDARDILHVKGLSGDGLVGRTPLYDFREKLGELSAMERFSQSFYGNGMKRSGVLKHPATLSPEAQERLTNSVTKQAGADKAFSVMVLEEGMDFSELSFAPEDAQLLDTRRFGVEDACRIYNLPPYKLRLTTPGSVSYASVQYQAVDYLISTLTPWLVRVEQAIDRACLTLPEREKQGLFVEHNTRALLRTDLKSQSEALEIGVKNQWYTRNEAREFLGENPADDPRMDDYFAPTYVQTTTKELASSDETASPA